MRHRVLLFLGFCGLMSACSDGTGNTAGSNEAAASDPKASDLTAGPAVVNAPSSPPQQTSTPIISDIQATNATTAFTISGSPVPNVLVGDGYRFVPSVQGVAKLAPQFSITNCPSWLTFNPVTGELFGTPELDDIGTFSNISIGVLAGGVHMALDAFSITVTGSAPGTAVISWAAPTQNVDGSVLEDLTGYRIDYGPDPASLTQSIVVASAAAKSYVIGNLSSGVWYFVVKAYSANNVESDGSLVVTKSVL